MSGGDPGGVRGDWRNLEGVEVSVKDLATKNTKDTKKDWPKVRLGDVCEEIRERISSSKVSVECYVTTDNMVKGCGGVRVADNVPESVGLVCYQKGDVLLSNIRPYLKKSWLADRDGGCSNDVIVFRASCIFLLHIVC